MSITATPVPVLDPQYDAFLARVQEGFTQAVLGHPLFQTDAQDLFSVYLAAFSDERQRQFHTCSACRRFVDRFGGLVVIDPMTGQATSPFWEGLSVDDPAVQAGVDALAAAVRRAKVTGPFLSGLPVWGQPETHGWHHLAVAPPAALIFVPRTKKHGACQEMAARRENYRLLQEGLGAYRDVLDDAAAIVASGTLTRDEKVQGQMRWMQGLMVAKSATKNRKAQDQLVWLASATAPMGWSHLSTTVLGTLLDDLKGGATVAEAKRRFDAKMQPWIYQRPQAAPSAGNIAQAEALIAELGLEPALHRRYARFEELRGFLWQEAELPLPPTGGVFDHLKPQADTGAIYRGDIDCGHWTWTRFAAEILPTVTRMTLLVPSGAANFTALVTAVHPDAPPILQWDTPDRRNPVSLYVYVNGSLARQWGLVGGQRVRVRAVVKSPAYWDGDGLTHHAAAAVLIVDGAKDTINRSLALFPEILKSDLREVRATIEAYSNSRTIEGEAEASACGLAISTSQTLAIVHVQRQTSRLTERYCIERWQ